MNTTATRRRAAACCDSAAEHLAMTMLANPDGVRFHTAQAVDALREAAGLLGFDLVERPAAAAQEAA